MTFISCLMGSQVLKCKMIRNATKADLNQIALLERKIEGEHAASLKTLNERLEMFSEGFYLAEEGDKIKGYVESCRWNREEINSFDEIKNFPEQHIANGRFLYGIFMGVDLEFRRKGIGRQLVRTLQDYAKKEQIEKIQCVSGKGFLVEFYKNLGFVPVKLLPYFYPKTGNLTYMEYKVS